jgi:hypothetical protein
MVSHPHQKSTFYIHNNFLFSTQLFIFNTTFYFQHNFLFSTQLFIFNTTFFSTQLFIFNTTFFFQHNFLFSTQLFIFNTTFFFQPQSTHISWIAGSFLHINDFSSYHDTAQWTSSASRAFTHQQWQNHPRLMDLLG